jgi:hypothetical protein
MNRTIILALSLAVVLLAATASTASAGLSLGTWNCPPPSAPPTTSEQIPEGCYGALAGTPSTGIPPTQGSFDFGYQQIGTTSAAQRFALGVTGDDSFNPRTSVSGDYAQTNNCPPTLSAPAGHIQGCLITVTFAPTGTGPRHGTLSTGPGGPTVRLLGTGKLTTWDPLELEVGQTSLSPKETQLKSKLTVHATTNNDSRVVVSGDVKRTTKRLAAGEKTKIKVGYKHKKQLKRRQVERDRVGVKIRFAATDEFDQTATEKMKTVLCRRVIRSDPWCDLH